MVLCSIEEAWGSNFNQNFNYNPGTSQTYQKENNQPAKNRYRYNFHRSSEPLKDHNGSFRNKNVYDVTINNNSPPEEEYQFETSDNFYQQEENHNSKSLNNHRKKEKSSFKNHKKDNNDLDGFYDNDNNYENFDSQTYNDNSDDDFDISKLGRNQAQKNNMKTQDNTSSDSDSDSDTDDEEEDPQSKNKIITSNKSNDTNQVKVNFDMTDLNQRFNELVKVIEKYTLGNGNDMKDMFLFIFLGIFVIFILDLFFRIGQKFKS